MYVSKNDKPEVDSSIRTPSAATLDPSGLPLSFPLCHEKPEFLSPLSGSIRTTRSARTSNLSRHLVLSKRLVLLLYFRMAKVWNSQKYHGLRCDRLILIQSLIDIGHKLMSTLIQSQTFQEV